MYLNNYLRGFCTNLGVTRFIAALLVIYAHSFPLSVGYSELDYLMKISDGRMSFGSFAVYIFFISSGLLVSKSIEKDGDIIRFAKKRLIRIFPPLWVVVIGTLLIIGPLFSVMGYKEYFGNPDTWKYLGSCLLLPEHAIPGLFENNIYYKVINGSLWTLRIEIVCYVFLVICYKINFLSRRVLIWLFPALVLGLFSVLFLDFPMFGMIKKYYVLLFAFYMGMLFWVYRELIRVNLILAGFMGVLFWITIPMGYPDLGACLFFPYCFIAFVFATPQCGKNIGRLGNLSYGIYLCAFPLQQCVVDCFGGTMKQELNFVISTLISILVGWGVYELAEKKISGVLTKLLVTRRSSIS